MIPLPKKKIQHLATPEKLNIKADRFIGYNEKVLLEKHILKNPMSIHVNSTYILNKYISVIRSYCGESESKHFFLNKYHWIQSTFTDIE